ncbi:septum formation initiator family protein [candidate division KSB1 bacterium]|nr:septum formation initiator family protein [candidate division KSB1 bacterium]
MSKRAYPYPLVKGTHRRSWIVLALIGFAFFSFLKVWQTIRVDQLNRRNAQLNNELQKLADENALLQARIEQLKSEERIVTIARERLGLVSAPKISIPPAPD